MIWAWYKHLCSFNFICKEYDIVELQDKDSFILYSNDHCDQPRITFRGFHIYDIKSPLRQYKETFSTGLRRQFIRLETY